jgi:hypothetical protein
VDSHVEIIVEISGFSRDDAALLHGIDIREEDLVGIELVQELYACGFSVQELVAEDENIPLGKQGLLARDIIVEVEV